jgi:hypothetical protein
MDAVQWLQRAFSVADQPEDKTASGMVELKVSLQVPLMSMSSIVYSVDIDYENSG